MPAIDAVCDSKKKAGRSNRYSRLSDYSNMMWLPDGDYRELRNESVADKVKAARRPRSSEPPLVMTTHG